MPHTDHIGEVCPSCGTYHRVIETIPHRPLCRSDVEILQSSEKTEHCMGIMWMSGGLKGMETDEEVTENVILTTQTKTQSLTLYEEYGWVVEAEWEHEEDEDPEDVFWEVYNEAGNMQADAFREVFGHQ